ncbi:Hypothetical predicted protein [Lecanosticta acicola]|uniref:Uncharacterized protein n=1 Tax=Lecanosticta acicola TaxID=111012 RepID=A0AAI8YTG6_9PEZI|nr:Hypothetical predicted protein [Lecanosticta acicola]
MNVRSAAMPGRGRRTPGKPGRFDPSEPLHMTTRHAKRNGISNGTPSANGSVEDDESRRGSLDDLRPTTSHSLGSQTSAKGRRVSGTSTNGASDVNMSLETESSAEKLERIKKKPTSPVDQQISPSRKRKRSTPTPPFPSDANGELTPPSKRIEYRDPRDAMEAGTFEDLSDRESDVALRDAGGDFLGVAQSTELTPSGTPAGSEAVSPVSDDSTSGMGFRSKDTEAAFGKALKAAEANELEMDDAEEIAEADDIDDVEDLEDVDDGGRADDDDRPRRKLAGRRRADHHDPDIEALMRRQLQLKSAYRSIARALKPVLAEIARKTVEDLESNPALHEQVAEYQGTDEMPGIQKVLDDALARRKAQLDAQYKWSKQLLYEKRQGEVEVRGARCDLQIEDFRQLQLDRLQHDILVITRQAQMESGNAGYETEDEDGDVIPMPKQTAYRFVRSDALDARYDSRSRLALESERAIDNLQLRVDMNEMIREARKEDALRNTVGFTVMDSTAREAAQARNESINNTNVLAAAAAETERISSIPVIPNDEAYGLQMLGDLCSRPSIRATTSQATPKQGRDAFMDSYAPTQMPPPPLPPPFTHEGAYERPTRSHPAHESFRSPPPASRRLPTGEYPLHTFSNEPVTQSPGSHRDVAPVSPITNRSHDGDYRLRKGSLSFPPTPNQGSVEDGSPSRTHRFGKLHSRNHSTHSMGSPSHARTPSREGLTWEQYHRPLSIDQESRPPPTFERNIHEFSHSGPLSIERVEPVEQKDDEARILQQPERKEAVSPSDHLLHVRRAPPFEPPSNPGAADSRGTVASSPVLPSRNPLRIEELAGRTDAPPIEYTPGQDVSAQPETSPQLQDAVQERDETKQAESLPVESQDDGAPEDAAQHESLPRPEQPGHPEKHEQSVQTLDGARVTDASHDSSGKKSRSRASSIISQSTGTEVTDETSVGDSAPRKTRHKSTRSGSTSKTSRGDRNGLSRKLFKTGGKRHTIGSPGGPQMHRFRLNTVESTPPGARWPGAAGASGATPAAPPPPHEYYGQSAYSGHPPPPGYAMQFAPGSYPYQYPWDYHAYQHRNSFPPPHPATSPSGHWPPYPQTQSPLYAVPQGTQPPPPPGPGPGAASPEPWPPGIPIDPAIMGPNPQSPLMQHPPPPPTYVQARAAPIAPATPDTRYPPLFPGGPSNHAPAFAQQQRQHEGENRKKSKSEVRGSTFKHWAPKASREQRDRERAEREQREQR